MHVFRAWAKPQRLLVLVDPPCLCLQEVVSEVQRDESKTMHTLVGVFNTGMLAQKAII
jgi:hypothetical protein